MIEFQSNFTEMRVCFELVKSEPSWTTDKIHFRHFISNAFYSDYFEGFFSFPCDFADEADSSGLWIFGDRDDNPLDIISTSFNLGLTFRGMLGITIEMYIFFFFEIDGVDDHFS